MLKQNKKYLLYFLICFCLSIHKIFSTNNKNDENIFENNILFLKDNLNPNTDELNSNPDKDNVSIISGKTLQINNNYNYSPKPNIEQIYPKQNKYNNFNNNEEGLISNSNQQIPQSYFLGPLREEFSPYPRHNKQFKENSSYNSFIIGLLMFFIGCFAVAGLYICVHYYNKHIIEKQHKFYKTLYYLNNNFSQPYSQYMKNYQINEISYNNDTFVSSSDNENSNISAVKSASYDERNGENIIFFKPLHKGIDEKA